MIIKLTFPFQAMEDAENSMVSAAAHDFIHRMNDEEENEAMKSHEMKLDGSDYRHVEVAQEMK